MTERIAVFIDGSNLYATAKALGIDIDYKELKDSFGDQLSRIIYYTAVRPIESFPDNFDPLRPLLDWLEYNGYSVVTKQTKEWSDETGRRKIKGNMDIEIAVDALELADHVDEIHIFSGDSDFEYLIHAIHKRGIKVTVWSSLTLCADELRRASDRFIDIKDMSRLHKKRKDPPDPPNVRRRYA